MGQNGSGYGMKPGDWECVACGDVQFARNIECRKCGAPKPEGFGQSNAAPWGQHQGSTQPSADTFGQPHTVAPRQGFGQSNAAPYGEHQGSMQPSAGSFGQP